MDPQGFGKSINKMIILRDQGLDMFSKRCYSVFSQWLWNTKCTNRTELVYFSYKRSASFARLYFCASSSTNSLCGVPHCRINPSNWWRLFSLLTKAPSRSWEMFWFWMLLQEGKNWIQMTYFLGRIQAHKTGLRCEAGSSKKQQFWIFAGSLSTKEFLRQWCVWCYLCGQMNLNNNYFV